MTLAFIIYLIQFLDTIKIASVITAIAFAIVAVVHFLAWVDTKPDEIIKKSAKSDGSGEMLSYNKASRFMGIIKHFIGYGVIAVSVSILIPSQRTAYMMAGGYVTQAIAESPAAAVVGNKVLNLINAKLDSLIKEELDKITTEHNDGKGQAVKDKN